MKNILLLFLTITIISSLQSQTTGSFLENITFNSNTHTLAIYVPLTYSSSQEYKLIVALHGCGGDAINFRDDLINLSDSLNAIILAPDFFGNQIDGSNGQIIPNSIDTLINNLNYNIDESKIFLTGFSCNGQETFKQGWNNIFPFAGLIPFNAWIPSITTEYNFDSNIPTCICSGDLDGSYNKNTYLFDSLNTHNGLGKFVSMPGIGHQWGFAGQDIEMMKCFNWMDSISVFNDSTTHYNDSINNINPIEVVVNNNPFIIFPNPAKGLVNFNFDNQQKHIQIVLYDSQGKMQIKTSVKNANNLQVYRNDLPKGMYSFKIYSEGKKYAFGKFIFE